jgi:protein-L-isoaspartate(D-aspartate) O-methyltransferase
MAWLSSASSNAELVQNLLANDMLASPSAPECGAMLATDRGIYAAMATELTAHTSDTYQYGPYADAPQSLPDTATISAPWIHAYCLSMLAASLEKGGRALDIGCGSGIMVAYMARVLASHGHPPAVTGIDKHPSLVNLSLKNLAADNLLGVADSPPSSSIAILLSDGHLGHAPTAPYTTIHVGASSPFVPPALVDQLALGGTMILPLGSHQKQVMTLVVKDTHDGEVTIKHLDQSIRYLPLKPQTVDYDSRYKKGWCYNKQPNVFLEQSATPVPFNSVGDLTALVPGCGYGRNALHLSKLGYSVTGVDLSKVGIDKTTSLYKTALLQDPTLTLPEPTFVCSDFADFELVPNTYDLICLVYAPLGLSRLYSALKPGGVLIVECFAPRMHELNVRNNTNYGPPLPHLISLKDVKSNMPRLHLEVASEETIELSEGSFHRVKEAGVVRVVGRKLRFDAVCDEVTAGSFSATPLAGDLYLSRASNILSASVEFAAAHGICSYCWSSRCHCNLLRSVFDRAREQGRPQSSRKIKVTIVTHPVEFMRGTNTTRVLPDILSAFGVEVTVHVLGSADFILRDGGMLLYPGGELVDDLKFEDKEEEKVRSSELHIVVPDGTWAHTKSMLENLPCLQPLKQHPFLSLNESKLATYESELIEVLNAGSGMGRITTAEAVGMAVGTLIDDDRVLESVREGVHVVSGEYRKRTEAWEAERTASEDCSAESEALSELTRRMEQHAHSVSGAVPGLEGVRWCRVCGVGMGSGKRMAAHIKGKKHCELVARRARSENAQRTDDLTDEAIWKDHCEEVMRGELAEAGDYAVAVVEAAHRLAAEQR